MFGKRSKLLFASALCICATLMQPLCASAAEGDIALNAINFPDAVFRKHVSSVYDVNQDLVLSEKERAPIQIIKVHGLGISSLKGIEYFPNITRLWCADNQLAQLDLSNNSALTDLNCASNLLTSLNLSKNAALTQLSCSKNQLKSLDVSKNTALTHLNVDNNKLNALDISKNAALIQVDCGNNQLTTLDVSSNPLLETLDCGNNQLTKLDVSKNTKLLALHCEMNRLTNIDVSKNTKLTRFECYENMLTSIDVTHNPELKILGCDDNQLTKLDVSKNTKLGDFQCYNNKLTELDVSHNPELYHLYCNDNLLTSLDVSKNTKLDWFDCSNNKLTSLDISKNTALTELSCSNNQLKTLDVSKNTNLYSIICDDNQLKALDVSMIAGLEQLWCNNNQLTELNVSLNPKLDDLMCLGNQLTELDVSKNPQLSRLWCDYNQLTELDITKNPRLVCLYCSGNQLTELNITQNPGLYDFYCNNNQLAWLDMSANTRDDLEAEYIAISPQNIRMTAPLENNTWIVNLSKLIPEAWLSKVKVNEGVYHSDLGLWMIPANNANQFTYSIYSGVEEAGDLTVTLHLSTQEISVELPPKTELMQALLTQEEIAQVNAGAELSIWLEANALSKEDVKIEERHQIERVAENGMIAQYLDLNLFKQIGTGEDSVKKITETGEAIAITLPIPPEYLSEDSRHSRIFGVIRVHNNKAEKLESYFDFDAGEITFMTNGFSTYALYYVDTGNVSMPNTGDNSSLFRFSMLLCVSLAALLFQKRRNIRFLGAKR